MTPNASLYNRIVDNNVLPLWFRVACSYIAVGLIITPIARRVTIDEPAYEDLSCSTVLYDGKRDKV